MVTKKFLSDIKERLLLEKQERLKKANQKMDVIDTSGDETDGVQGDIQIDLQYQFAELNKLKLSLIESALDRIDNHSYGTCVDCDEQISEKRLIANPYYLTCVACAESREAEEKQRKRF